MCFIICLFKGGCSRVARQFTIRRKCVKCAVEVNVSNHFLGFTFQVNTLGSSIKLAANIDKFWNAFGYNLQKIPV